MKAKLKLLAIFVAGSVFGGGLVVWLVAWPMKNVFETSYVTSVRGEAETARLIRAGQEKELLARIEEALPGYVLAIHDGFNSAGATNALWTVQRYYQQNDLPIPAEIKPILDALPPKPPTSCQLEQLKTNKVSSAGAKK